MNTTKKVMFFFTIMLILALLLLGWIVQKEEMECYENLCEAYEQRDYDDIKKYLKGIRNFSRYPKAADIAQTVKHLDEIEYYDEKLSQIKSGVWIKNEFSDYKYLYEDKDMDPDLRDSLVEMMEWNASGQWTVEDYEEFYEKVEKYQKENIKKEDEISQKEFDELKERIKKKKNEYIYLLSQTPPKKGMKEEEIQYTSWGKPNSIVDLEDSMLKWENQRMNRKHRIYIWYGKTWDGYLKPIKQVWTHYSPKGEGFVLAVHEGEDLINVQ